jgi:hypothetical protein
VAVVVAGAGAGVGTAATAVTTSNTTATTTSSSSSSTGAEVDRGPAAGGTDGSNNGQLALVIALSRQYRAI